MSSPTFDNSYASLPETFYARTNPSEVPSPTLVRLNHGLCRELTIDTNWLESKAGVSMLAGNLLPESADPIAMVYGGHQFGGWNPQLGDGRAILIGELLDRNGLRRDVQLKGSGRTPFSRGGDGKATLGAILREYIVSEAMFALGIPTTRALAVTMTGETVYRDRPMPGAILTRVSYSHVRVGTFEYFGVRNDRQSLRALANYIIDRHYPRARDSSDPYVSLLEHVVERQAQLVARWMQLGFIHGVMNTDNMQVAGETIDYGPCAFMDNFHPNRVFSSIDKQGRYAWDQQPSIAKWNLTRMAEALLPLFSEQEELSLAKARTALATFEAHFESEFLEGFRRKLGLLKPHDSDSEFIASTFAALSDAEVDFTLFFRRLSILADEGGEAAVIDLFASEGKGRHWIASWRDRIQLEDSQAGLRAAIMRGVNPIFIPRNHRIEEAIEHANSGDFTLFHRLVAILSNPYQEQEQHVSYERAPEGDERVLETFCGT